MFNDTINYGKIIKDLRRKYKLTQSELGDRISVGKTAISNYETGYSTPSAHVLEKLADIFDMSLIEFLSYGSDYDTMNLSLPRLSQPVNDTFIPYLKEGNVTENIIKSQNYMDTYITVPAFMTEQGGDYICVKMPDNSMDGDNIKKNDYIIVRKAKPIENRKIILAIDNETKKYIIRRYIRDGHIATFLPSSSSPQYPILRADERDDRYTIIGYVEKAIVNVN